MQSRKTTLNAWNRINAFSRERALFRDRDPIVLAISGGPDSVVMLDYFARQARGRRLKLYVCHINHGLRGAESDADERFVRRLAAAYGLSCGVFKAKVKALAKKSGSGTEHAARTERYRLLLKYARSRGCRLVATAHHSDDNAETVLLNLLRGTKARGLAGIPPSRPLGGGVRVIRPLLALRRREIEDYLRANGIKAQRDSTNDDQKYTRNWIRATLLPLLEKKQPRIREHLVDIAEDLSEKA
ncbi:MAG: tRNA(Ile)-lysidine synthase [Elusimicrobia bacterium]|nr:MAG: tRNA(Ile)-lysidine synthase [Elusimicrobiota bacterium]KAF0155113.1 MAG: tRNA(Ile)-lysidine synthase [Elusimicrobiota bacterium]